MGRSVDHKVNAKDTKIKKVEKILRYFQGDLEPVEYIIEALETILHWQETRTLFEAQRRNLNWTVILETSDLLKMTRILITI